MSEQYFTELITRARTARSPEAIANLLKPVLFEMSAEFDQYLEALLASTAADSSAARTLKLIARVWREQQSANRREVQLRGFVRTLATAEAEEWPDLLIAGMDPNGTALDDDELQKVIRLLEKREAHPELVRGLERGLKTYLQMETTLLDWLYGDRALGFVRSGPWGYWAQQLPIGTLRSLFEALDRGESARHFLNSESLGADTWVEMTVLLRRIERYLVRSFETRYPNLDERARTAILTSTFLTFAIFWADFAQAIVRRPALSEASFKNALQSLRSFASQPYFPLYGGLLALFDGPYLRTAITYLGEPLRADATSLEKAKVLNLLGYTARFLGDYERSVALHREALEDLDPTSDPRVRIANLVNQGSTHLRLRAFETAIELFERALVYARQSGDTAGSAHALANLGNAVSQQLQFQEALDPEAYERAESYLNQGLERAREAKERTAEVVALTGLGALKQYLGHHDEALTHLDIGLSLAAAEGDLWWQGIARAARAEVFNSLGAPERSAVDAVLAMLMLERAGSADWRQPAGLVLILRTRLADNFRPVLEAARIEATAIERVQALLAQYTEN